MATNLTSNTSQCNNFLYNSNLISALTFLMFPIALLLNAVAAWVSLHLRSTSTFVVYLKNLVAADLVLTLMTPIKAASDLPNSSNFLISLSCRYFSTTYYSTQYTCIALLGLISLDRFFKIMMPQNKLCQKVIFSQVATGSVWFVIFTSAALPNIILTNKQVDGTTKLSSCMNLKEPVGKKLHSIVVIYLNVFFWIVSVIVAFCYFCIANKVIYSFRKSGSSNNKGKKKIRLRVFLVVIIFFVSFTPYHIVRIPYTFQQLTFSSTTDCYYFKAKFAKEFTLWLTSTNTCMNPLLYVFLCREFKEKLTSMMKKCFDFI